MIQEELKNKQVEERDACIKRILDSKARKKIVVAGPGSGKTYTFSQLFKQDHEGPKLAMTFIRKLTDEMNERFGDSVEVKTFHAFCKKYLHDIFGRFDICPYLSSVIEKDAAILQNGLSEFDAHFQRLEIGAEIEFYIQQGDYYGVSSFNDSVYRLLSYVKSNPEFMPQFGYIVVDEYQDFNSLEVEFLDALETKGPILIVGDDDQAVYDGRHSTPTFLRDRYSSGIYEKFELPFCSRCTKPVVEATDGLIRMASAFGLLKGRIPKRFEYFIKDKEVDSQRYPKISIATCSTGQTVVKYIRKMISGIPPDEIEESYSEKYPTVLIIGPKHYLNVVAKGLGKAGLSPEYEPSDEILYTVVDGYRELLGDIQSNLGWRILTEFFGNEDLLKTVINAATGGPAAIELVGNEFRRRHSEVIDLIRVVKTGVAISSEDDMKLRAALNNAYNEVYEYFSPKPEPEDQQIDKTRPSILLKSFVGSKGMSAGHVFVIGANDGDIPKNPRGITDIELCQFLVALTRTRKKCHVLSTKWLFGPKDGKGQWIKESKRSQFIRWLPETVVDDLGEIKAASIK